MLSRRLIFVFLVILFVASVGYWMLPHSAELGVLENTSGIPYPQEGDSFSVLEPLSHIDVHVPNVLARQVTLTFSFIPKQETQLSVGVRQNAFWLSYPRHIFYEATSDGLSPDQPRRVSVTLPLTAALRDHDGTIDVMFFAGDEDAIVLSQHVTQATTHWQLADLTATVEPSRPTVHDLRAYALSLLTRERPQ